MKIECPKCDFSKEADPNTLPQDRAFSLSCPKCKEKFVFDPRVKAPEPNFEQFDMDINTNEREEPKKPKVDLKAMAEKARKKVAEKSKDNEEDDEPRGFDKIMYKIMSFLGLTKGSGFIGIGTLWFFWCLIQYVMTEPQIVDHQILMEIYFVQALMSLILVAFGVLIMEIKKKH